MLFTSLFLKGVASFVDAIATEIPTHSSDEILRHDKWYIEYCVLLEGKKEAIKEWRTTRLKVRNKTCACIRNYDEIDNFVVCDEAIHTCTFLLVCELNIFDCMYF